MKWFLIIFAVLAAKGCEDKVPCHEYKEEGYCEQSSSYFEYMKRNCQLTCAFCRPSLKVGEANERCEDSVRGCEEYTGMNYCDHRSQYYDYMQKNCRKACKFCRVKPKTLPKGVCDDSSAYAEKCVSWQKYCQPSSTFFSFMKKNCQKTCSFCKGGCSDSVKYASKCPEFKSSGYCSIGSQFYNSMLTYCKRTCNLCNVEPAKKCPGPKDKGRVVGGVEAQPYSWPWQVGITYDGKFHCGGTLIHPNWLITAAHCVVRKQRARFQVTLADHDRSVRTSLDQVRGVEQIISYPGYSLLQNKNDIALMKLDRPAKVNRVVVPACLPEQTRKEFRPDTRLCFVTGWGKTSFRSKSAKKLQEAVLPVVTNRKCASINAKVGTGTSISEGQLCAGTVSDFSKTQTGCRGDSGGPLACRFGNKWTVEGVVSEGDSQCQAFQKYTVFTRVSAYRDWIKKHTGV